ncbi:MAG: ATP-binding protein [Spirochaetales bacterium]|nr:ATP-binding protein [Spirochaetales bacterium]
MGYLKHKGKKYTSVVLKISKNTDFSRILDELHQIFLAGINEKKIENIRYSLLELVNNSIRAHKEQKENRDILLRFKLAGQELIITLRDWGGGFDKSRLPYDLDQDVQKIDINDQNFLEYREVHGYQRFGMGLLITKKTFDRFKLSFTDHQGNIRDNYEEGQTAGTVIELRSTL